MINKPFGGGRGFTKSNTLTEGERGPPAPRLSPGPREGQNRPCSSGALCGGDGSGGDDGGGGDEVVRAVMDGHDLFKNV